MERKIKGLVDEIQKNIGDSSQPSWFPELTPILVNQKWKELKASGRLPEHYQTNNFVHLQNASPYIALEKVTGIPLFGISSPLMQAGLNGTTYTSEELGSGEVLTCLSEAFRLLAIAPSLENCIKLLVQNLHLIKPADNGYDISYSLPEIPFSIFVSIPSTRTKHDALRVAEAILHESMHLQLTLIDEAIPLLQPMSETKFFSPWKKEFRHPLGLIHGIYVFTCIQEFLESVECLPESESYRQARFEEIGSQLKLVERFCNYPGLTYSGKAIIQKGLSKI